jgi:hypothetical protein
VNELEVNEKETGMCRLIPWKSIPWLWVSVFTLILFACAAFLSTLSATNIQRLPFSGRLLPGEQIWRQGVPSFLFGTNDTYEWSPYNIETQPAIQDALRTAGFPLMRSFFRDGADDASIEQRVRTIEKIGAHCLGVITSIFDIPYAEHLVRYLGDRCLMYEFGNEPDYNGISAGVYLRQWNHVVPLLRKINPQAAFIGPTLSSANLGYLQTFLTGAEASKILPDAISFHWYPCYQDSESACLKKVGTVAQEAQEVRALVGSILGRDLPVGITEWNFDPSNPPPGYGDTGEFISQFTSQALHFMIQAGVSFACQFDAASFAGYGHLDMFDQQGQPKWQYYAIKSVIEQYRP